ncbi:MAG: hypothetical protein E5V79_02240, partial [Mesorhizobium sp.]
MRWQVPAKTAIRIRILRYLAESGGMALNFEDIVGHPALNAAVQAQARAMQQAYEGNPRASSVFAT